MSASAPDLFNDDHGRPFGKVLEGLRSDLKRDDDAVAELLAMLKAEAGNYGSVRSGDPTPALRLLAFDGLVTELLGHQCSAGRLGQSDFRRFQQILGSKSGPEADK
jgi:hypothetical protein